MFRRGEPSSALTRMHYAAGRDPMSKIRINELARELEVKPNVILDLLPELGVGDKKTHSSSLDDDVALEVRRRLTGGNGTAPSMAREEVSSEPAVVETSAPAVAPEPMRAQPRTDAPAAPVIDTRETRGTAHVEACFQ